MKDLNTERASNEDELRGLESTSKKLFMLCYVGYLYTNFYQSYLIRRAAMANQSCQQQLLDFARSTKIAGAFHGEKGVNVRRFCEQ